MKICRFLNCSGEPRIGEVEPSGVVLDLGSGEASAMETLLCAPDPVDLVNTLRREVGGQALRHDLGAVELLPPLGHHEVWAAGVTYLRSKAARMEESDFSATAYDRVYEAERPELFFKALAEKVVPPGGEIGIRSDSSWSVPEPELVLVINPHGRVVGFTAGNDVSARDIEGQNLLYLPQAKTYHRSCTIGPWVVLGADEPTARGWDIRLTIHRSGADVFSGETKVSQIRRGFADLASHLTRCQEFPHGVMLLTGTGIVPPDDFSLEAGDRVRIEISGIGVLENPVIQV